MPITVLGGTKLADTTFSVANSCRFNGDAYVHRTFGSAGNVDRWTFSAWFKIANSSGNICLFAAAADSNNYGSIVIKTDGSIEWQHYASASAIGILHTDRELRDVSAWYHLVCVYDSANGTAGNRMRIYINGLEETAFATDTNPSSGQDSPFNKDDKHVIGAQDYAGGSFQNYWKGYMAEVCFIDGTAYAASDFGEFDSDSPTIWKPKDVSGLTFGTNGFYLDFEDSSNLGNDANGGTDYTEVSLAAADQSVDSPTNNFCTMNSLDNEFAAATFTEGNNQLVIASGTKAYATGTMGVSAGKWYWEIECDASDGDDQSVSLVDRVSKDGSTDTYSSAYPYNYVYQSQGRYVGNNEVIDSDPDSFGAGDIIGVALDLTNNKLYFAKNNTWQNSGDPTSGATGTGAISTTAASGTLNGFYFPAVGSETTSRGATWKANFGGCSAFDVSSAAQDGNGYGNFEYAPPSGYLALCSKNLGSDGG
tara:strand:+ start:823 stop:2256 length:1434 start_codon:yes stop_codon:yes gene_type:complete